jgi:tetratricopeptide (TPR) repeat protein
VRPLYAFILLGALALPALAEPPPSKSQEAKRLFEEATADYNLGKFAEAAELYKQAYQAKSDPAILYNIAQSYRLANDFKNALFFYRSFLHNLPAGVNRNEVEDRIRKLEDQLEKERQLKEHPPNEPSPRVNKGVKPVEPTAAPAPAVAPAPATTAPALTATAQPTATEKPRTRWWVWAVVGAAAVVAVGVGVGVGVALGTKGPSDPSTHLGTVPF